MPTRTSTWPWRCSPADSSPKAGARRTALERRGKAESPLPQPRWNGEPLAGRTILLRAEQGLGDTLQFVRYARLLKERGARVVVEAQPALVSLVRRCPGVDQVIEYGGCAWRVRLPPAATQSAGGAADHAGHDFRRHPVSNARRNPDRAPARGVGRRGAPSRLALPGRAARRIPAIGCARFRSRTSPASPDWRGSGSTVCSPAPAVSSWLPPICRSSIWRTGWAIFTTRPPCCAISTWSSVATRPRPTWPARWECRFGWR